MKVRLIITSTENGESEHITFTEEYSAATQFCHFDQATGEWEKVDYDQVIHADLPGIFPLDRGLKKVTI